MTDILTFTFSVTDAPVPQINANVQQENMYKSVDYILIFLYLTVLPTELSESAQFLNSNCPHRCMELIRITLAVVVRKHPGSAASLRGECKIS